ncbi:hypothetical protein I0C86_37975 [Plantactinospora sp. S1510]|uniref:Uncharacterized protein n=1 Tax=Plantactinospora alkalitolerans TaxID=2789879 RepID=A0ABS0H930_9ACTN|nr:hypothetical protein [Plantactinospora alkalitolerans]MBF9134678.1 hypothetical protein [Plantactinospora alkalitolerans]
MYDSRDQTSGPARIAAYQSADRRLILARVHRIATDYAGGYREGLVRAVALAELNDLAADPDLLAQAAAMHAVADNWYAINAVDLLLEAGAPTELIDSYLDEEEFVDSPPLVESEQLSERRAS